MHAHSREKYSMHKLSSTSRFVLRGFAPCRQLCDAVHKIGKVARMGTVDRVIAPAPLLGTRDQTAADERLHVVRQRRLGDIQLLQKVPCADRVLLRDYLNDAQPVTVGKRIEGLLDVQTPTPLVEAQAQSAYDQH